MQDPARSNNGLQNLELLELRKKRAHSPAAFTSGRLFQVALVYVAVIYATMSPGRHAEANLSATRRNFAFRATAKKKKKRSRRKENRSTWFVCSACFASALQLSRAHGDPWLVFFTTADVSAARTFYFRTFCSAVLEKTGRERGKERVRDKPFRAPRPRGLQNASDCTRRRSGSERQKNATATTTKRQPPPKCTGKKIDKYGNGSPQRTLSRS